MTDELAQDVTAELAAAFDVDDDIATEAGEKAAAFAAEYELDLAPAELASQLEAAPYDSFEQRFNWWVGDVAADLEDCTNSRDYRFVGFDAVEAVQ